MPCGGERAPTRAGRDAKIWGGSEPQPNRVIALDYDADSHVRKIAGPKFAPGAIMYDRKRLRRRNPASRPILFAASMRRGRGGAR
jgi:hypothetical protein